MMTFYSARDAARITRVNYHNILYWVRSGLVKASGSPHREKRQRHAVLFHFTDLLEIKVISELRQRGASPRKIRRALNYLKSLGPEYISLFHLGASLPPDLRSRAVYLDVSGNDIQVHRSNREVISAVTHKGQRIIHALMVDVVGLRADLTERALVAGSRA
jgi:DNA-binding transcriptional MerR regulator